MAKTGRINFGGGGGIDPDDLNAKPEHVLNDIVFGGFESDDPQKGTMPNNGTTSNKALNCGGAFTIKRGYHAQDFNVTANSLASQTSATATAGYIYSGKTAWVNGSKITGNMTVGSILNFSAAAYSGRQILLKWQNPYAATGKPFSGVFINYSTGGYPGSGGTRIYTGSGNNNASGGWSQVIVTMPNLNTTYYFSATAYCSCSAGDFYGNTINGSARTQTELWLTFTSSQNYTIPAGFTQIDLFAVGGGSSGKAGSGGGGSGYTKTVNNISVSASQVLNITVGAGGAGTTSRTNNAGSISQVVRSGSVLIAANGGTSNTYHGYGTDGGSGGGSIGYFVHSGKQADGGPGGSNGSNGVGQEYDRYGGSGQGTTTRAWGSATGTLYAGGGGGSGYAKGSNICTNGGAGGAGGGGHGGRGGYIWYSDGNEEYFYYDGEAGTAGSHNTGSGGGGGGDVDTRQLNTGIGGAGGSGIILAHVY